jgi:hypothetical protein
MRLHKFNRRWALIKLNLKQNKEKYIRVGTLVFSIVIFIIGITFFAFAKFNTQDKYNVMQSTVGTFVEGDYILASYLDGTKQDNLPTKSDSISVDHIDCDNGATGTWNYTDWAIYITGATKRTKCTVYFVTQAHTGATEGDSKLGTASTDQVLSGSTFSSTKGTNITGTMANNGALNWAPTSSTTQTVTPGYYSGGTLDSSAAYNAGAITNSMVISNITLSGSRPWAFDANQSADMTNANYSMSFNVSNYNSVVIGTITTSNSYVSATVDGTSTSISTDPTINVSNNTTLVIVLHNYLGSNANVGAYASASISSITFSV